MARHGPMVLGVCRRVLGDPHAADDAFQATFLVLARKAAGISDREAVDRWLYGVASRVAAQAHVGAARHRKHEDRAAVKLTAGTTADPSPSDLRPVLFEELNRLPDKYREPIVLCINQVSTDDLQEHAADLKIQQAQRDVKQTELQRAETRWNRAVALQ